MSGFFQRILGGRPAQTPAASPEDADFADFAGAPQPTPLSSAAAASAVSPSAAPTGALPAAAALPRPYTKWYRVWERTYRSDFTTEAYILPIILLVLLAHFAGLRANRRKIRAWASQHIPLFEKEYALVGFTPKGARMVSEGTLDAMETLREKSPTEYAGYATGRANVAFSDLRVTLAKRHNPMARAGEEFLGFFFEGQPAPRERVEVTSYAFDGREYELAPLLHDKGGSAAGKEKEQEREREQRREAFKSRYDDFVFAVVHKDMMKRVREERYDLSLTSTKEHARLPVWCVVMSESAEITEGMLSKDVCEGIKAAGEAFEMLVVTDQPEDQPKKLNDALPRKKLFLSVKLPSSDQNTTPLLQTFLRLPDHLAAAAHFRPEAIKRVRATRDEEIRKIRKLYEDEKAEERRLKAEKDKREERDRKLRSLGAEEQRKVLERERAADLRKGQKGRKVKG